MPRQGGVGRMGEVQLHGAVPGEGGHPLEDPRSRPRQGPLDEGVPGVHGPRHGRSHHALLMEHQSEPQGCGPSFRMEHLR